MRFLYTTLFAFISLPWAGASFAEERKAVFELTSGDAEKIESRLLNGIKHLDAWYKEQGDEFKAVVVISGKAYKYFIEDLKNSPYQGDKELAKIQKRFRPLIKELNDDYGVRFDMCGAGMKARGIEAKSLYPFVHTNKVQPVYMIDWQNQGYAYIPMH